MTKLLNRNNKAGFTLVELIVVIAILAILAGIAIPVYSGYIKKADKAADEQLLGAVNTAFAAACQENFINRTKLSSNSVTLTVQNECITGVNVASIPAEAVMLRTSEAKGGAVLLGAHLKQLAVSGEDINKSFQKYFGSNNTIKLRVYNSFTYDPATGTFIGETKPGVLKAGYNWVYNAATLQAAYNVSSFSEIEVSQLTGTIDSLTNALSEHAMVRELADGENFKAMLTSLNIDPADVDEQTLGNLAVFFVADQLGKLDKGELMDALISDVDIEPDAEGNYNYDYYNLNLYLASKGLDPDNTIEGKFVKTALLYGMATAYANSNWPQGTETDALNVTPTGLGHALSIVNAATNSSGWSSYIFEDAGSSEHAGTEDLDAFLEVLSILNDNKDAFSTYSGEGLYSSGDILEQIAIMLGKN